MGMILKIAPTRMLFPGTIFPGMRESGHSRRSMFALGLYGISMSMVSQPAL